MAKGLDVGTMNITCSEKNEKVSFSRQRNAFLEIDASDLTQGSSILQRFCIFGRVIISMYLERMHLDSPTYLVSTQGGR